MPLITPNFPRHAGFRLSSFCGGRPVPSIPTDGRLRDPVSRSIGSDSEFGAIGPREQAPWAFGGELKSLRIICSAGVSGRSRLDGAEPAQCVRASRDRNRLILMLVETGPTEVGLSGEAIEGAEKKFG